MAYVYLATVYRNAIQMYVISRRLKNETRSIEPGVFSPSDPGLVCWLTFEGFERVKCKAMSNVGRHINVE